MNKGQIVTITFFRFTGRRDKWWAFPQMGRGTASLSGTAGLTFAKLLGSGSGNGFSIVPDLGRYGLLGVWEEAGNARQFFSGHPFFLEFRQRSEEYWTVFMRTAIVHGQWDSLTPFHPV